MDEEPESNDARLVIRLASADDEWLAEQGKAIGVGKAVVARLLIQWAHRRNLSTYQLLAWLAQASTAAAPVSAPLLERQHAEDFHTAVEGMLPDEAVEDIVAAQLAEAERNGQTAPRAAAAAQQDEAPIRALRVVPRQPGKAWAEAGECL